jgi:plasmid stabilization system protein ParE
MSYAVKIPEGAQQDLRKLRQYLIDTFCAQVARETYAHIKHVAGLLQHQPQLGAVIPELAELGITTYRQILESAQCKIIYEVDETNEVIYLHVVCSTRQNFFEMLYDRIISL